ncbi:NAD(P)-dependent oxidoreductase [Granulicatella sp. zg-ZJ]|uniref:Gfo/Idh/MocA family oxidoreductase n=1 Tax=unclassified Granulicatella TaxID=2630493 RepID=UPI0013C22EE6|nr:MULTISPECIES: Gfo/Idh/MocA family oxidoreductase [unclassified Granulicatella]MBS4750211.1 Gfo/Idh/MocA family oxidoreductase [Carnobacteriaceae bacterium zg-ZUI78]NEW63351.1 NAD(P)-dependent oxidoreductase [Granulicatella sp. zg-ZJ]NEW65693.1 NAD(P)-dependent oxidoreductase [Granulicatella sp. zg-84]QMI85667.1 Gfo/Idh/MocA family oxidoreductase [Carnobacteriaceae bacterium zg-84]
MLTLAYIGNGKSTNRYHLPFVRTLKDKFKVKYVYVRHFKSEWEKQPYVTYTTDLDVLLKDTTVNLIVITTPMASHYEYAKLALEHGKHVLVEKPFVKTAREAKELFQLAKEKGLILECYQNRRFDSDFLTVQKVIDSQKLGDIYEIDMHFDYFRPEVSQGTEIFNVEDSFVYTHACHTLDQVISCFGVPTSTHFDVRQLLGEGRMNDYFDIDLYYQNMKVSVKSSYFRIKPRPSFVVYGMKGTFIKDKKDRQEEHLKYFYMPEHDDFGVDTLEDYGVLTYVDDLGCIHEEKIVSEKGHYKYFYEHLHDTIVLGKEKLVKDEETILQIELLEKGVENLW